MLFILVFVLDDLDRVESQMRLRPRDAMAIARQYLDQFPRDVATTKSIFQRAAKVQESIALTLSPNEISELVGVYRTTLSDSATADTVETAWLDARRKSLGAGDGSGRIQLARWHWLWRRDREIALQLCKEAEGIVRDSPDLQLLRRQLEIPTALPEWENRFAGVKSGQSMTEVESMLGPPSKKVQQILSRRYREQWWYDRPGNPRLDWDCVLGKDPKLVGTSAKP